jgi:hypothetical protein
MTIGAAVRGIGIGAIAGLVVGVAIDFFHVNVRAPVFFGVALGPSIEGPLLGAMLGLSTGLIAGFLRRASSK